MWNIRISAQSADIVAGIVFSRQRNTYMSVYCRFVPLIRVVRVTSTVTYKVVMLDFRFSKTCVKTHTATLVAYCNSCVEIHFGVFGLTRQSEILQESQRIDKTRDLTNVAKKESFSFDNRLTRLRKKPFALGRALKHDVLSAMGLAQNNGSNAMTAAQAGTQKTSQTEKTAKITTVPY